MARRVRESTRAARPLTVLLDTNVLLDVLLDRDPWADDATLLLNLIATGVARGYIASHAVTTLYCVVERARGRATAVNAVSDLLQLLDVVSLDAADFQRALALGLKDYEDAVQVAACLQANADFLVTRNGRDFKGAPVTVRTAGELLSLAVRAGA